MKRSIPSLLPGQFGREGDHPDGAVRGGEQGVDLGGLRIAQLRGIVRTAACGAEPWALQMDAGDRTPPSHLGEHTHLREQLGRRRGHQACQRGGGAVAAVERGGPGDVRADAVGVGRAAAAVHVHVDKPGHHNAIREPVVGLPGRCTGTAREDLSARRLQPTGSADPAVENDGAGADQRHSVSVTLRSPRGLSGSPPRAIARCRASCCSGRISNNGDSCSGTPLGQRDPAGKVFERRCRADAEHVGVTVGQPGQYRQHGVTAGAFRDDGEHRHLRVHRGQWAVQEVGARKRLRGKVRRLHELQRGLPGGGVASSRDRW